MQMKRRFAALLGVVLTTQVATNTLLGKALGNPYIPATVNMVIGFFATVVPTLSLTSEWPSREMLWDRALVRLVCWWTNGRHLSNWNNSLAPKLGAGALVGLVVAGQLISRFCSTSSVGSALNSIPPAFRALQGVP